MTSHASGDVTSAIESPCGLDTAEMFTPSESSNSQAPANEETSPDLGPGLVSDTDMIMAKSVKNPALKRVFAAQAPWYCAKTGYSHSIVKDLGLKRCPACLEELAVRMRMVPIVDDAGKPNGKDKDEISYEVEYTDQGGYWIGRNNWDEPFDLQRARKGVVNPEQQWIIRIVTVLRTSEPKDTQRTAAEKNYLMDQGILDNPRVHVSVNSTKIIIYSKRIVKVLNSIVPYYPDINLEARSVTIMEPYCILAHYLTDLERFQEGRSVQGSPRNGEAGVNPADTDHSPGSDDETWRHIETVLKFVKNSIWKGCLEEEKARHSLPTPTCTFSMLWLLFKPGDTVYFESDAKLSAAVIQAVSVDPSVLSQQPDRLLPYKITLWYLDFDGRYVRRWSKVLMIAPFDGEMEINKLSVIPCSFMDARDNGETRHKLESEGEHWYKLLTPTLVRYHGPILTARKQPKQTISGRVEVDCNAYEKYKEDLPRDELLARPTIYLSEQEREERALKLEAIPKLVEDLGPGSASCPCKECKGLRKHPPTKFIWKNYDLIDPEEVTSLDLPPEPRGTKHRYLICSRRLGGFVLKTRTWEVLDVACCADPGINKKTIDTLVMPGDKLDMIKALVHGYTAEQASKGAPSTWAADFVENKGEGRIFLLHGSPGVGKTYTAECIAEYTGRPLLSLTCGDLGNQETQVERQLSKWFALAERWGAVMLLDEADVYTEKRVITDLNRNSMVSVFLRCMEYYKGILFLTTNRVGTFDDAFVSRIHVVIHYKNLGESERQKIWQQFFDKLARERGDIIVHRAAERFILEDPDMKKIPWNGREIRNAFQTAVALADYEFSQSRQNGHPDEGVIVTASHFKKVCNTALQFKEYISDIYDGLDETQRAALHRTRAREGSGQLLP
ncbi:ATPase [Xylariomycetidae sp. FL0641]|nr:ATPase [Xylariomycetidae sp. FL0641]